MADSPLTSTKFYKEKTEPLIFQAHTDQALGLTFSPDGNKLFTCGLDKYWKVWNMEPLKSEF